jgi:hypothetical protein
MTYEEFTMAVRLKLVELQDLIGTRPNGLKIELNRHRLSAFIMGQMDGESEYEVPSILEVARFYREF